MRDTREVYLATATAAIDVLSQREVATGWDRPSALAEMDVAALAGHLARAVLQVEAFLDAEAPSDDAALDDVVSYYLDEDDVSDRSSPSNVAVRQRGAETAADGHAALVDRAASSLARLRERLASEPDDRRIVAFDHPMSLDEYLRTRVVEIVVHVDDLAVSVDLDAPRLPDAGVRDALDLLVAIAIDRIGTTAAPPCARPSRARRPDAPRVLTR